MSEGIITGTIYETRLRDKNCCLRYGKKKKAEFLKAFLLFPVAHDFLTGFLHNFPVAQAGYCLPVSGCQSDFLTVFLQIPVVQAGFCL